MMVTKKRNISINKYIYISLLTEEQLLIKYTLLLLLSKDVSYIYIHYM